MNLFKKNTETQTASAKKKISEASKMRENTVAISDDIIKAYEAKVPQIGRAHV